MRKSEHESTSSSGTPNTTDASTPDPVHHPNHYIRDGLECKDVIQAMVQGTPAPLAWAVGNAVKYLWRYWYKGNPKEDLMRAREYIDIALEHLEKHTVRVRMFVPVPKKDGDA